MAATRPAILAALKALLAAQVTAVAGKVYLPWDAIPETAETFLQIEVEDSQVDPSETIGRWLHRVPLRIGAMVKGKFDAQATWNVLNDTSAAILANGTLSGQVQRMEVTGAGDSVTVAGDKILWPHITVEIAYFTPAGAI